MNDHTEHTGTIPDERLREIRSPEFQEKLLAKSISEVKRQKKHEKRKALKKLITKPNKVFKNENSEKPLDPVGGHLELKILSGTLSARAPPHPVTPVVVAVKLICANNDYTEKYHEITPELFLGQHDISWNKEFVFVTKDVLATTLWLNFQDMGSDIIFGTCHVQLSHIFTSEKSIQSHSEWLEVQPEGKLLVNFGWIPVEKLYQPPQQTNPILSISDINEANQKQFIKDQKYDLDLTYITDRIIVTSFPGDPGSPMLTLQNYLNANYPSSYKVYNLCSEKSYPPNKFYYVAGYPIESHTPPSVPLMVKVCQDIDLWLGQKSRNIAVVHSRYGKSRTGVMISAYLCWCYGSYISPKEAIHFFNQRRNPKEMQSSWEPSQKRFVHYFASLRPEGPDVPLNSLTFHANDLSTPVTIIGIVINNIPNVITPSFRIISSSQMYDYQTENKVVSFKGQSRVALAINRACVIDMETCIAFYNYDEPTNRIKPNKAPKPSFCFWFHTKFLDPSQDSFSLNLSEVDRLRYPNKYPPNFKIVVLYRVVSSPTPPATPRGTLAALPTLRTNDSIHSDTAGSAASDCGLLRGRMSLRSSTVPGLALPTQTLPQDHDPPQVSPRTPRLSPRGRPYDGTPQEQLRTSAPSTPIRKRGTGRPSPRTLPGTPGKTVSPLGITVSTPSTPSLRRTKPQHSSGRILDIEKILNNVATKYQDNPAKQKRVTTVLRQLSIHSGAQSMAELTEDEVVRLEQLLNDMEKVMDADTTELGYVRSDQELVEEVMHLLEMVGIDNESMKQVLTLESLLSDL